MPLLEIIEGEQTTDETLDRALDVAKQIKKTPIVVNDSRGFFTSRVIGTFINEGIAMLAEGVPAPTIEQASLAGRLPGAGAAADRRAQPEARAQDPRRGARRRRGRGRRARGSPRRPTVIDRMVDEFERGGRLAGAGFYEYEDGKRTGLWPGLRTTFPAADDPASISLEDLEERMLFIEAIETVKCLDEGVLESVADANIGSIIGIGFPAWTGGVLQYINGYDGGVPASSPARASWRRRTASASSRPRRWSSRPSAARATATSSR